jgi:hypothetical protein
MDSIMQPKFLVLFALALGMISQLAAPVSSRAQISQNIVGYINQPFYTGDNFIANQLSASGDNNTLSNLFNVGIPEGTTFTEWSSSQLKFLPLSTYDQTTGWSINYDLTYGEGGLLHTPSNFTNLFVGTVWPGFNGVDPFTPPLVSSNGLFLLSCYIPIAPATFFDVVGRAPNDGDYVRTFNPITQLETVTTYEDGSWDHGAPALAVGQSAFFGLGVGPAPEPSTLGLAGAGIFALAVWRNLRRR